MQSNKNLQIPIKNCEIYVDYLPILVYNIEEYMYGLKICKSTQYQTYGGITMEKIADIIKYEGDNSTFIWKYPCENFNTMTQLIVHESQEAIFLFWPVAIYHFYKLYQITQEISKL